MVHIGTQYYRPPFPEQKYWKNDIREMKEAGLNALQLWVVWAWVESTPGSYVFDDYDRIIESAGQHGLGVVLSTIAEIHPYWIHRAEPNSEMIDNFGHKVVSSNRGEIHFGITPGGCFDHPGVKNRMADFLVTTASRYAENESVVGWDAWNELRWNVQADGLVCYCDHTLARFRSWLDTKYDGLDGLNDAWRRRYDSWDDIMPGKMPNRPYTEMMAFQEFLTWRANEHTVFRYSTLKPIVGDVDVTVHGGNPTILDSAGVYPHMTALNRGNDWVFAETVDGIGCSSFPLWKGREMDPVTLHCRFEYLRSAAGSKKIWLSELQGGRYNIGFHVGKSVDPVRQQRWIWNGYAIGADKVLFWCWRDEVFGRESNGFGFIGNDGMRAAREAAMRKTGELLGTYGESIESYRPDRSRIGVFFGPASNYLYWSEEGTGAKVLQALQGYTHALTRIGFQYEIIEENHLDSLADTTILFMPRIGVLTSEQAKTILTWVKAGGRLVVESETGSFSPVGIYRYPEDRLFEETTVREIGRRELDDDTLAIASRVGRFTARATDWVTPMARIGGSTEIDTDGVSCLDVDYGEGSILYVGSFPGNGYYSTIANGLESEIESRDETYERSFETWLEAEAAAVGVKRLVSINHTEADSTAPDSHTSSAISKRADQAPFVLFAKAGNSCDGRMVYVFLPAHGTEYAVRFDSDRVPCGDYLDIMTSTAVVIDEDGSSILPASPWGLCVLIESR
jgi:beta-galactosidase